MEKLRIGIVGYGRIGKSVEAALGTSEDMVCSGIFTRRDPATFNRETGGAAIYPAAALPQFKNQIDVIILCNGSSRDLPQQAPVVAGMFNTVDCYDNHAELPAYLAALQAAAKNSDHVAVAAAGWDPGLFSVARCLFSAVLPGGASYTFWGRGVSQGHTEAIRRIPGVVDACQYTVPNMDTLAKVGMGSREKFTPREMHTRECYVAVSPGADLEAIAKTIKEMPGYFAPYDTNITYVSSEELTKNHSGTPHGGLVVHSGETSDGQLQMAQFQLNLGANASYTAAVMVAYARAAARLAAGGASGAYTCLDIPPALLHPQPAQQLAEGLL